MKRAVLIVLTFASFLTVRAQLNQWCVVMTDKGFIQAYRSGAEFPYDWIEEKAADGYAITDITYGEGEWVVVVSQNTAVTRQTYKLAETFPGDWISEKWQEGYSLGKVTFGDNQWAVWMTKGTGAYGDAWAMRTTTAGLKEYIEQKASESKGITSIAFGNGTWAVTMANGTGYKKQVFKWNISFPKSWIDSNYELGYRITEVAFGQGLWFVVMSMGEEFPAEAYSWQADFPAEDIKAGWDEGNNISTLHYTYEYDATEDYEDWMKKGLASFESEDYPQAIEYFSTALQFKPADSEALNMRAWSKFVSGQCEGALNDAQLSVTAGETHYNVHTRASVYNCLGRWSEAIDDFTRAIELSAGATFTTNKGIYYGDRAKARFSLANYQGALDDYDQAILFNPEEKAEYDKQKQVVRAKMAEQSKPTISWDLPYYDFTTTSHSMFNLKACVNSKAKITKARLYVNGIAVGEEMRGLTVVDNCALTVDETISLKPGKNIIYLEVSTEFTTVKSATREVELLAQARGNYRALLIGVDTYTDPGVEDLARPIADAKRLREVLINHYTFNPADVILMENPTKAEVLEKLIFLQESLTASENILVFYSGHGAQKEGIGYWLLSDATASNRVNWLANSELTDFVKTFKSQHSLLISDACYSGSILTGGFRDIHEFACEQMEKLPSRRAITSGAISKVPDQSVFLDYLVKKLTENQSSCFSAEELYSLLKPAVIFNSPNSQIPQFGVLPQAGDEGGNFIFKRK